MASHTSLGLDDYLKQLEPQWPTLSTDPDMASVAIGEGAASLGTPYDVATSMSGVIQDGTIADLIFEKLYVIPLEIDAGFIVENVDYPVKVWNSSRTTTASITDITITDPDGLSLVADLLPKLLQKDDDTEHTLTVEKDGPAVQSSTIQYTVNGVLYTITVEGKRAEAFPYLPNWKDGLEMDYRCDTSIFKSRDFAEQRRPIRPVPVRTQKAKFLAIKRKQQRFHNRLRELFQKTLMVPIFPEMFRPDKDLQNETILTTGVDLSKYWNLNNLIDYIVIVDVPSAALVDSPTLIEVKEIDSVAAGSVTVTKAVVADFKENETVIFPAFIGVIKSKQIKPDTQSLVGTSIEFAEGERLT